MAYSQFRNQRPQNQPTFTFVLVLTTLLTSCNDVVMTLGFRPSRMVALPNPSNGLEEVKLNHLMKSILQEQFNETVAFANSTAATLHGIFPSEVRVHFQGEPSINALRDKHVVPDLSSLATLLTLNVLVEATTRSSLKNVPTSNLVQAIESLGSFQSPLFGETRGGLMVFWPVQAQGQPDNWTTHSDNAVKGGRELIPFCILRKAVNKCQDKCPLASQAVKNISRDSTCLPFFNESLSHYAKSHNFPPDVTSSFANLGLGSLLYIDGDDYSSARDVWLNKHANLTQLMDHVFTCSYKPLSSVSSNDVIDSRTYYVIEKYLSQLNSSALEQSAFVTNWIAESCDEGRVVYGGRVLPTYNTIDLFATATFLHSLTSSLVNNLINTTDSAKVLISSNLDLLKWVLSNGRNDSLDLLMTSHPSTFQFYWMLSRTMFEMERARVQGLETYQLVQSFYSDWNTTVRHHVTEAILKAVKDGGLDGDGNALAYVDDVLPVSRIKGKDDKQFTPGNDRLFATASAANSLLAAWTVLDTEDHLLFLPDIRGDVALATNSLVNYVFSKCVNDDTSLMNVFRSTTYKHCQSLSCYYPATDVVNLNGTSFNGSVPSRDVLFGTRGVVSSEDYSAMLQQPHFGHTIDNSTLHGPDAASPFFFWSSPSYTRAMCLLAVAQMKNLKGQVKNMNELMNSFGESGSE